MSNEIEFKYVILPYHLVGRKDLTTTDVKILAYIRSYENYINNKYPRIEQILKDMKYSQAMIYRSLSNLTNLNLISESNNYYKCICYDKGDAHARLPKSFIFDSELKKDAIYIYMVYSKIQGSDTKKTPYCKPYYVMGVANISEATYYRQIKILKGLGYLEDNNKGSFSVNLKVYSDFKIEPKKEIEIKKEVEITNEYIPSYDEEEAIRVDQYYDPYYRVDDRKRGNAVWD